MIYREVRQQQAGLFCIACDGAATVLPPSLYHPFIRKKKGKSHPPPMCFRRLIDALLSFASCRGLLLSSCRPGWMGVCVDVVVWLWCDDDDLYIYIMYGGGPMPLGGWVAVCMSNPLLRSGKPHIQKEGQQAGGYTVHLHLTKAKRSPPAKVKGKCCM